MNPRARTKGPPPVAALYPLTELVEYIGGSMTYQSLERLLIANGVEIIRSGRGKQIPLSEIERRIPSLWRSIVTAEAVRQDARIPLVPSVPTNPPSGAKGR